MTNAAPSCERVREAGEVGGAQALAHRAVQHLDGVELAGEAVGDAAGPVGRVVVDDEDAMRLRRGALEHDQRGAHDRLEVLGLVVGGEDEPGVSGHRPRVPYGHP